MSDADIQRIAEAIAAHTKPASCSIGLTAEEAVAVRLWVRWWRIAVVTAGTVVVSSVILALLTVLALGIRAWAKA